MFEQVSRQLTGKSIWMCKDSTEYERSNAEQPFSCAIISDPKRIQTCSVCYERKTEQNVNHNTASQRTGQLALTTH